MKLLTRLTPYSTIFIFEVSNHLTLRLYVCTHTCDKVNLCRTEIDVHLRTTTRSLSFNSSRVKWLTQWISSCCTFPWLKVNIQ
jgi:hypothetical protein